MDDSAKHNWVVRALIALTEGLLWMTRQIADPAVRASVYQDLGVPPPAPGASLNVSGHFATIDSYINSQEVPAEQMKATLEELRAIYQALRDFAGTGGDDALAGFDAMVRLLTMNYIRLRAPLAYWLAQPLLLLDDTLSSGVLPPAVTGTTTSVLHNIAGFFEYPIAYLRALDWPPLDTSDDAAAYEDVLAPVVVALGALGAHFIKAGWFRRGGIEI